MKQVDLLIYDLDGTLVNTLRDITSAVNFMLGNLKLPLRTENEVKGFIGEGVRQLVERSLGDKNLTHFDRAFKMVKKYYAEHLLDQSKLYPGVLETLEYFKRKKQAVLTNKPEKFSTQILKHLNIQDYFLMVIGGDTVLAKKPETEGIQKILTRASVTKERAIMIGDSTIDICTGKNSGVETCAVSYGFSEMNELKKANPDYLISQFSELPQLFS